MQYFRYFVIEHAQINVTDSPYAFKDFFSIFFILNYEYC